MSCPVHRTGSFLFVECHGGFVDFQIERDVVDRLIDVFGKYDVVVVLEVVPEYV